MNANGSRLLTLSRLLVGCCSIAHTSAAGKVIVVPFEFYRDSIVVPVSVNGKGPYNMLLDTGVDPSIIHLKTAKEIGLKLASTGQRGAGGGAETNLAYETNLPRIQLGALKAKNIAAAAIDLSKASKTLGMPVQGVLGYSLLKKRVVQFDYPQRVVRFYSNSSSLKQSGRLKGTKATSLPFRYQDEILVEGILVNGKRMVANIDTGSNAAFQLTPSAVKLLGLQAEVGRARAIRSMGVNGVTENRQGHIRNIAIGGISIEMPAVVFYGKGFGHDHENWGLRIGNAFLKDLVVTVDYAHKVIILTRPLKSGAKE